MSIVVRDDEDGYDAFRDAWVEQGYDHGTGLPAHRWYERPYSLRDEQRDRDICY
jgi:hypothetical protein